MKYSDIPQKIREILEVDELLFGNSFCCKNKDGSFERIDPMTMKYDIKTKKWAEVKE